MRNAQKPSRNIRQNCLLLLLNHANQLVSTSASVSHPNATSDMWKYFEKSAESNKVKCSICSKLYRGGMSNLWQHLLTQHLFDCLHCGMRNIQDLMACLEPGYTIPSRKLITSMICQKREVGKELLCENLKKASLVALITDIWTSRATQEYITVTAHYITAEWKQFVNVLETKGFPERHTRQAISE